VAARRAGQPCKSGADVPYIAAEVDVVPAAPPA
jgi:hypothetical protein